MQFSKTLLRRSALRFSPLTAVRPGLLHFSASSPYPSSDRISFKTTTTKLTQRCFSGFAGFADQFLRSNRSISFEQAIGAAETLLLYLEHGNAGNEMSRIKQNKGESIGKRYRDMMAIYFHTQLYVIAPFGFEANEKGLFEFQAALLKLVASKQPQDPEIIELRTVEDEALQCMLNKAFGIKQLPKLDIGKIRYLASLISSSMQDEAFLGQAEYQYKKKLQERGGGNDARAEATFQLQDELLVPCYLSVVQRAKIPELPVDDLGYVLLQALITQNSRDIVVAQNMASAITALNTRAPIWTAPGL